MAVYKRSYNVYPGPFTPTWSRFLVLPRYSFRRVFASRWMLILFVLCFVPVLVYGAIIYLRHNVSFLATFNMNIRDFLEVDGEFFGAFLGSQFTGSFFITAIVGPGLISPDLVNNALPLYLSRPFSRAEYVIGKMAVLFVLMSALTWIPGLALIGMQTSYAGLPWLLENIRLPFGILLASLIYIGIIALLALALSAWVRWRIIAGAMLFAIFFVPPGFGLIVNEIFRTKWGSLIDLPQLLVVMSHQLVLGTPLRGAIPIWGAVPALACVAAISLFLLHRRLQAYEVIR